MTQWLVQVGRRQLLSFYGPDQSFGARDSVVTILFTLLVFKVFDTRLAPVEGHVVNFRPRHRVLLFLKDLGEFAGLTDHFLGEHADIVELFFSALGELRLAIAMDGHDIVTVFQVEGPFH